MAPFRPYMSTWLICRSWLAQAHDATPQQRWHQLMAHIGTRISNGLATGLTLQETPLEVPPTTPQPAPPTPTKAGRITHSDVPYAQPASSRRSLRSTDALHGALMHSR